MSDFREREVSRRNLLSFGLSGRFKNSSSGEEPPIHDIIFERIGETLSIGALLYVAYRGSQDQLVTYKADSESRGQNMQRFPEKISSIDRLYQILTPVSEHTSRLFNSWRHAYEKTECNLVTHTSTDSKGNVTVDTTLECDTVWREPWQITLNGFNHNTIYSWNNFLSGFNGRVIETKNHLPQAFTLKEEGFVFYNKEAVDHGSQTILALLAYGAVGSAFSLYEELVSKLTGGEGNPLIKDNKYIKRRTLIKVAAAGLLATQIRRLQLAFVEDNQELLGQIQENTRNVLSQLDVAPEVNFQRYFLTNPPQLRDSLIDIRDRSTQVLNSYDGFLDFSWGGVKPDLIDAGRIAGDSIPVFDRYFSYDTSRGIYIIPEDLTEATKYLWGTKQITDFVSSKSSFINTRHLRDAFFMLLGLTGTAALTETIFIPASEKVLEAISNKGNISEQTNTL